VEPIDIGAPEDPTLFPSISSAAAGQFRRRRERRTPMTIAGARQDDLPPRQLWRKRLMNRRNLITTLAVATAVPAALAVKTAAAQAMGEAEMKHVADTKKVGTLSLTTSRVALKAANDATVKQFAEFETAEQETIADVLKTMESGSAKAEGALHPPSESEAEAALDPQGKQKLDELKGLQGAAFDKAYVTAQLDGHKKLLTIQEDYLKVGQVREHLSVAKLARGQIKEHISHLETLQSKVG
jgi:putative membrane protein